MAQDLGGGAREGAAAVLDQGGGEFGVRRGELIVGRARVGEDGGGAFSKSGVEVAVAIGRFAAHGDEEVAGVYLAGVVGDAAEVNGVAAGGEGIDRGEGLA